MTKKLGSGAFGDVFLGTNIKSGEHVGIKLEHLSAKFPQLVYEVKLYKMFEQLEGLPRVQWYGVEGDYNVMVMDLLGPSLEDLFHFCGKKMSLKSVLMIADQVLTRIEGIHSLGFIHRDIKPDNFLMGAGKKQNQLFVIDLGLSKRYLDPKTGMHIAHKTNRSMAGTVRYASVNNHEGVEQSRRDDLESIGYVLVYLLKGKLPWQGLKGYKRRKDKTEAIKDTKIDSLDGSLCEDLPEEFQAYFDYVRSLEFDQQPDYDLLR